MKKIDFDNVVSMWNDPAIQENRLEWITALESGKYKQTRGALRAGVALSEDNSFCCLGVQCNLINPDIWLKKEFAPRMSFYGEDLIPPTRRVMYQFGMDHTMGTRFAKYNDDGWTFRQIAFQARSEFKLWDGYVPQSNDKANIIGFPVEGRDYPKGGANA